MAHHRSNSRRRLTISKPSPTPHQPSLPTIPSSPLPSQSFESDPPALSMPTTASKPAFRGFLYLQDALRSKPSVAAIPRQLQRRATYIALLSLVALSVYFFVLTGPFPPRGLVPLADPSGSGTQRYAPAGLSHPAGMHAPPRKLRGSSWRKAKAATKIRPQVTLDSHEELAAVTAFMASLPENRIPADVDPSLPVDPELILDFDTRSAGARAEVDEVVRDTWRRNPVVLFGKVYSPQAREIKRMLDALNLAPAPTIFDIDRRVDATIVEPLLARLTATQDLPVLLVGGEPVGSLEDIRMLSTDGKLGPLVEAAGAKVNGKKKKGGRKH